MCNINIVVCYCVCVCVCVYTHTLTHITDRYYLLLFIIKMYIVLQIITCIHISNTINYNITNIIFYYHYVIYIIIIIIIYIIIVN